MARVHAAEVSGQIVDQDGRPPPKSQLFYWIAKQEKVERRAANADEQGKFQFTVPDGVLVAVQVNGVGQSPLAVFLEGEPGKRIHFTAHLQPLPYFGDIAEGAAWLDSETYGHRLARSADGSLEGDVPSSGTRATIRIVAGYPPFLTYPGALDYVYSEKWGYESVLPVVNGMVHLKLDRTKYPWVRKPAEATFADGNSLSAEFSKIGGKFADGRLATFYAGQLAECYPGALRRSIVGPIWAIEGQDVPFREWLLAEKRPKVREFLALTIIQLMTMDRAADFNDSSDLESLLSEIPVDSDLWDLPSDSMYSPGGALGRLAADFTKSQSIQTYFEAFLKRHAISGSKRAAAISALRMAIAGGPTGKKERFNQLIAEIRENAAREPWLPDLQVVFHRELSSAVDEGMTMPGFSLRLLDGEMAPISPQTLKGHCYLIECWATWCGWCIAGLPKVEELYSKYHSKGFDILSLSIDDDPEKVRRFHKGEHPMPWMNCWVGKGSGQEHVLDTLMVQGSGVPQYFLVDESGRVIFRAFGGKYRTGEFTTSALEEALRKKYGF
jgi:thiol-disulfide isomerase/thioredoxin